MYRLSGVWRTAFGLGIIPLAFIIYWRTFRLRESAVWAAAQTNRDRKRETALLFRHFWHSYAAFLPAWHLPNLDHMHYSMASLVLHQALTCCKHCTQCHGRDDMPDLLPGTAAGCWLHAAAGFSGWASATPPEVMWRIENLHWRHRLNAHEHMQPYQK